MRSFFSSLTFSNNSTILAFIILLPSPAVSFISALIGKNLYFYIIFLKAGKKYNMQGNNISKANI